MHLRRLLLSTMLVGVFAAFAGSGCMASTSPRRGTTAVVYSDAGYQQAYVAAPQPTVVVAQPTYVAPTYVAPSYSYGYYPSRVVVAPAGGYYYDRRAAYYGPRGYYAPQPRGYYAPRGYYGPRQGGVVVRPAPVRARGPAVYVR